MTGKQPVLLIVQQDQAFAFATGNIASKCGYRSRIILDTREFSRAYRESRPTVIFMELFMPDLNGTEMVSWLIKEKSRSNVIMTVKNTPDLAAPAILIAKAAKLFTLTILTQPASVEEIKKALQAALQPS